MGHYASEMDGPPFLTKDRIYSYSHNAKAIFQECISRVDNLCILVNEVVYIDVCHITQEPDRKWIEIHYINGDWNCFCSIPWFNVYKGIA